MTASNQHQEHLAAFKEWALAEKASPHAAWEIRRAEARSLFEQLSAPCRCDKCRDGVAADGYERLHDDASGSLAGSGAAQKMQTWFVFGLYDGSWWPLWEDERHRAKNPYSLLKRISGLVLHHTCEIRHCVNPEHLNAITRSEHNYVHDIGGQVRRRSQREAAERETCSNGHPWDAENTYRLAGRRYCRACARARRRRRTERARVAREQARAAA